MGLTQYHQKRNFSKTTEPKGKRKKKDDESRLFIIQKHAASHLHYDFRLALGGTLKSWAIPKGPSFDPTIKRLAMHVEDHPLEYGSFEGIIPKGQYGGGTVMLWDKGSWESLDDNPYQAYQKGHLRFLLKAKKLKGRWDLIRFKDDKHWFLIKFKDEFTKDLNEYDITTDKPNSVISNYNLEEIAENYQKVWTSAGERLVRKRIKKETTRKKPIILLPKGLNKSHFPEFIAPQLATLVDKPPEGDQWLHEIKFDGYRMLAYKQKSNVILKSRNNKDWSEAFLSISESVKKLPFQNIILDGEVVVLDEEGHSDFQLLQNSLDGLCQKPFVYFIFDLLYFDKYDLRTLTLLERKSILANILSYKIPALYYSDHIIRAGKELYQYSCQHALEGIISKKSDAPYHSKRSKSWLKIKCTKRQEFVIGGYTNPQGARNYFGSLFLGVYDGQGNLKYTGNVGTGFDDKLLKEIKRRLDKHASNTNPFLTKPPGYSTANWVKPKLVCEVEFSEWTKDGHLRHPSFKGMRLDKKANDVIRESETKTSTFKKPHSTHKHRSEFSISNPNKILYPEDNITKKDLLNYYETVAEWMLPYIKLRPLTLIRCPSDYKDCFYQRHYNQSTHKNLLPVAEKSNEDHEQYIYLNNVNGLFSLVQMGVLEVHPWGSQITHPEEPDILTFDLDPGPDVLWSQVVEAAKEIRYYLSEYQLTSFVKSTGGKGLHIVIPILPEYDWENVKEFSHVFVNFLEKNAPDRYISKMTKSKRQGKIFVDYLRNQRTATAIAPFSTRARIHAPVSTPLFWEELSDKMEENYFTINTLPKRLNQLKKDPWEEFWKIKQSLKLDQFLD